MEIFSRPAGRRLFRHGRLVILLLLAILLPQGAMAQTDAPTVGEIVIDSYNCETGQLDFHVYVENVPSVPEGTSGFDYPLFYTYTSYYTNGTDYFPTRMLVWSPTAEQDPYTGDVYLTVTPPTENVYGAPGTGVLTSIDLYVGVGQYDEVEDSTTTTYVVDCTTPPPPSEGDGAGVPNEVELPANAQVPANPGPPADLPVELPENAGPPEDRGRPENPGRPADPGKKK